LTEEAAVKKEIDPIVKAALDVFGGDIAKERPGRRGAR